MEKLLDQSYNYAIISPVKNYSNISDKKIFNNTFESDIDNIEDIELPPTKFSQYKEIEIKSYFVRFTHQENKKKNIRYFYNDLEIGENLELFPASKKIKNFYTTKDRQIKKYFGDPFNRIEVNLHKRLIYKDENKLVIKILHKNKFRSVNWKFFKETSSYSCISFNLKTGNFTIISQYANRKKSTIFRTNSFTRLKFLVKSPVNFYLETIESNIKNEKIRQEFHKVFNDKEFILILNKELLNNKLPIPDTLNINSDLLFDTIVEDFVKKRGIKVPNDYKKLLINFYPLQKVLKKNDNKLIQSILDTYKIKSKGTIKYIHENKDINLSTFINTCYIFGDDYHHYVTRITPNYFTEPNKHIGNKYSIQTPIEYHMTKDEKNNMLNVINSYMEDRTYTDNFHIILNDHLRMIKEIRKYDPALMFNTRNYRDFNADHSKLSGIISKINKGWTIEYQFDEKMLEDVESDLLALKDFDNLITFNPYILKREEDYIEEGAYMHHCVASYANKDKSIIVSLRTPDKIERVTSEFDIQTGRCIQSRYFSNQNPPSFFEDGLDLLKEKVLKYARWGLLNWREKKKVPIKINGIEVIPKKKSPKTFHELILDDPFLENIF